MVQKTFFLNACLEIWAKSLSNLYRVIHKSMKHFKISQQIDYATDHGNSYADRERNSPSLFFTILQMLNMSTFGNTADNYAIVHIVPHACQHMTVDQSHSSGDTVAKILEISGEWRHKDYHKDMRGYLNRNLPQRWIGCIGKEVKALMRWPPRSPDLTLCDFVSGGL
jgi:hypothetical protein